MCATGPPIPKNLDKDLIGQYVFRQIFSILIGSESSLELFRQAKTVVCDSIVFPEKIPRASLSDKKILGFVYRLANVDGEIKKEERRGQRHTTGKPSGDKSK